MARYVADHFSTFDGFAFALEQKEKRGERSFNEAAARLRYYRDSLLLGFHALIEKSSITLLFLAAKLPASISASIDLSHFNMPPRNESEGNSPSSSSMKRSESESSFVSVPEDGPVKDYRDYRVRKSSLIA